VEVAPGFEELGMLAFTTTRAAGSFNLNSSEPASGVWGRWLRLRADLAGYAPRLASSHQVHGTRVLEHEDAWDGWLRVFDADGHVNFGRATAMVVSLADCVPVFIGHHTGRGGVLHAGWRGTAAGILPHGLEIMQRHGLAARDLTIHLGPAICGRCYEVGPEVHLALTGRRVSAPAPVDLRAVLAQQAVDAGVVRISISGSCTRCDNDRFFSHRAGDEGRQLGALVTASRAT
jgi:YfiH family protein